VVEVEDHIWQRQLLHSPTRCCGIWTSGWVPGWWRIWNSAWCRRRIEPQRALALQAPVDEASAIDDRCCAASTAPRGKGRKREDHGAGVRYVAALSNLELTGAEVAKLRADLDGILEHMDKLNEIDTTGVEPMAQVLFDAEDTATLRADVVGDAARQPGGHGQRAAGWRGIL